MHESFVTRKKTPGDFDACWNIEGVDIDELDRIEPVLLTFDNGRAAQKAKFGGEFFPAQTPAEWTPPFRIFLDFFQTDKGTGNRKGIIELDLRRWRA